MCYVIESRQLLANVLRTRPKVTVKELKSLARQVQNEIPTVAIDLSHYSLSAALEDYPKMFSREDDVTIGRTPCSEQCFEEDFVQLFFNQEIPLEIRSKFLHCIAATHG